MALCKVRYSGQRIAQMPCVRSTVALTSCGSHKAHPQMDAANNQDALFCFDLARHIGSKLPLLASIWRASSAPPKVPIIQPAVAEIT